MNRSTLDAIGHALRQHHRFAILSHVRPDGDALGSTLALALSLNELGKNVRAWNEEGMLEKYRFLAGAELLTPPPNAPEQFDVAIALDTATQNRLGKAAEAIRKAKIWINIDHHLSSPGYGDLVYIDPIAPATGQILFDLISTEKLPNTTARTFEIAADLIRAGVNVGRLSQLLYENYPKRRVELLRLLLGTMQFGCDDKLAWFSLSQEMAKSVGALPEDNEGLIDHLRAIHGLVVAIFFEELVDGKVRVSMRSKNEAVDVCAICQTFGGGGHTLAAGARVRGTLTEVTQKIVEKACDVIRHNS